MTSESTRTYRTVDGKLWIRPPHLLPDGHPEKLYRWPAATSIIFLDIDRTLNGGIVRGEGRHEYANNPFRRAEVDLLADLLTRTRSRAAPLGWGAKIVWTSNWRPGSGWSLSVKGTKQLDDMLARHGLITESVGHTPCLRPEIDHGKRVRADEIRAWAKSFMETRKLPFRFVVIDDDETADVGLDGTFINCRNGPLTAAQVDQAVAILNAPMVGSGGTDFNGHFHCYDLAASRTSKDDVDNITERRRRDVHRRLREGFMGSDGLEQTELLLGPAPSWFAEDP